VLPVALITVGLSLGLTALTHTAPPALCLTCVGAEYMAARSWSRARMPCFRPHVSAGLRPRLRWSCERSGSSGNFFVRRLHVLLWFCCFVVCVLIAPSHLLFYYSTFIADCNFVECQILGGMSRPQRTVKRPQRFDDDVHEASNQVVRGGNPPSKRHNRDGATNAEITCTCMYTCTHILHVDLLVIYAR